ncbi:MAG: hypothetical protein OQJ96_10335 [Flavobacteriales bacterium]|nr:hypothetical protein [Flavobacteriales bacterium]MCW8913428.1 hypothetical protein [Flavobacteriales bacterium]MCW8938508.1 hypothetical protein [Flavobacteriales bacterium]MCW8941362.1 hypothetical protein [Flavobacteriales bacterium]MCW8967473.1 hypothetical protein [Flavobacteriales bacterium]
MKTTKTLLILSATIALSSFFTSCSKDKGCTDPVALNYDKKAETDDGSCIYPTPPPPAATTASVNINFTHNFDGTTVTANDFNTIQYTNQFGNQMSISKLKYLISDIRFYKANGDSVVVDGYNYIDLTNTTTLSYALGNVSHDTYTGIGFNIGFDVIDNISNYYPDLNAVSWNWPAGLGGGYHYMQLEGQYIDNNSATANYAYHYGTAREINLTNDTIYHPNYTLAQIGGVTIAGSAVNIEIKMNIAEWFKNTYTWDLNVYNTMLMPNYNAQILMKQNAPTVFSLGTVN